MGTALRDAEVESALAPGMVALKSVDPPLAALAGAPDRRGSGAIGKMPVVEFAGADDDPIAMLVHLMSAGRLQVFDKRASLRDRSLAVLVRLADGRELRLREFGTKQRAWAKLMPAASVEADEMVATLGPGGVARTPARGARAQDRPAPPPPPDASGPARDRRDRPVLGG